MHPRVCVCTLTASTLSSCIILDQRFPCHPMTQGVQGVAGKGREGKKQRKGKREREETEKEERERERKKEEDKTTIALFLSYLIERQSESTINIESMKHCHAKYTPNEIKVREMLLLFKKTMSTNHHTTMNMEDKSISHKTIQPTAACTKNIRHNY